MEGRGFSDAEFLQSFSFMASERFILISKFLVDTYIILTQKAAKKEAELIGSLRGLIHSLSLVHNDSKVRITAVRLNQLRS